MKEAMQLQLRSLEVGVGEREHDGTRAGLCVDMVSISPTRSPPDTHQEQLADKSREKSAAQAHAQQLQYVAATQLQLMRQPYSCCRSCCPVGGCRMWRRFCRQKVKFSLEQTEGFRQVVSVLTLHTHKPPPPPPPRRECVYLVCFRVLLATLTTKLRHAGVAAAGTDVAGDEHRGQ